MITRNLTILLTDIKGFTDKSSHKTRAEIQHMLDEHKLIVLPILEAKGGKLIKTIGDAFLMTFESPTDAVLSGIEVQEALRVYNEGKEADLRIEIRIAINQGEVNLSDNDVYGEPVNITARIEAIAEANEVFFTDAVYLAMNKKEVPSAEVGLLQLKGIPEKVRVYKVKRETPVAENSAGDPVTAGATPTAADLAAKAGRSLGKVLGVGPSVAAGVVAAMPGVKMSKPTLLKRAAAVLIDACICGIIVSALVPGDREEVHIKKSHRAQTESAAPVPPPAPAAPGGKAATPTLSSLVDFGKACSADLQAHCQGFKGDITKCLKAHKKELQPDCSAQLANLSKTGSGITVDDNGIHGAGISIDDNGIHAPGVSIDDNGVHLPGISVDNNGVRIGGVTLADTSSKKNVNVRLGTEGVTVDESDKDDGEDVGGGWKMRTIRHEKKFPWFAVCWFVYSLVFLKRMGTTPGGRICKLAVVEYPSGIPITKSNRLMRAAVSLVSGWCLGLGYLWALWEKDGRGWHDLMAGTKVVSVD